MTRQRTLVTGAAGFVGRHLIRVLAGTTEIVGWHRPGHAPEPVGDVSWRPVDLTDRVTVFRDIAASKPNAIFHLAAAPSVRQSWTDPLPHLRTNVLGTHYLLEAVRRADIACRILIVSSGQVYAASETAVDEDARLRPISPYGLTKLGEEQLALRACEDDDLDVVVARPYNHIGPGQSPEFAVAHFARQIARIEAGLEPARLGVGNLSARRDTSDVRDVVDAYAQLMSLGQSGRAYNVCSGTATAVGAMLDALLSRAAVPVQLEHAADRLRPNDVPVMFGDRSRIESEVGWTPRIPLEQTLADTLEYWRAHVRVG